MDDRKTGADHMVMAIVIIYVVHLLWNIYGVLPEGGYYHQEITVQGSDKQGTN